MIHTRTLVRACDTDGGFPAERIAVAMTRTQCGPSTRPATTKPPDSHHQTTRTSPIAHPYDLFDPLERIIVGGWCGSQGSIPALGVSVVENCVVVVLDWEWLLTLGLAERQGGLLDDVIRFCDEVVPSRSVSALLHRERDRLFPDELFADCSVIGAAVRWRRRWWRS